MKILYDHQAFSMQNFGGVSRIYFELSKYLRNYPDVKIAYPSMFSNNEYIDNDSIIGAWSFFKNTKFKGKGTVLEYLKSLNKVSSYISIKQNHFDLFHPTYYDPYYLNYNIRKPIVVTCYDLIHEKYKRDDKVTLAWKSKTLCKAAKVIAISENTKTDLIEYYDIPKDKIAVVHLGSSFPLQDSKPEYLGLPFFLYIGHRSGYKNFDFFVKSIAPLLIKHKDLHLYCAGGNLFSKEELSVFKELGIAKKVFHFDGSNEILKTLYSQAIAFFYPSLYEGFGIPLLEAMSCTCPVVSSNKSSLPEVAADAAIYFDPLVSESIYHAANLILNDDSLKQHLMIKGKERVSHYSWEKMAHKTYDIYKDII